MLELRRLGTTKYMVSNISLGAASLGIDYGIGADGENIKKPMRSDAIKIVKSACARGINFFDTAPNYGESESILGEALLGESECIVATKVNAPYGEAGKLLGKKAMRTRLEQSVSNSCKSLKRECLQIVQIHNATRELLSQGTIVEILCELQQKGYIEYLGASVYGVDNAASVIESGYFSTLQVAYNILDQSMIDVFSLAQKNDVAIVTRSALLKGALTYRVENLPPNVSVLRDAVKKMCSVIEVDIVNLPSIALRFCLQNSKCTSTLVGVSSMAELEANLQVIEQDKLSREIYGKLLFCGLWDEKLTNPFYWGC